MLFLFKPEGSKTRSLTVGGCAVHGGCVKVEGQCATAITGPSLAIFQFINWAKFVFLTLFVKTL